MDFRMHDPTIKILCYVHLSVYTHISGRIPPDGILVKFLFRNFTNISRYVPILVEI
jgi:hypothetical protein